MRILPVGSAVPPTPTPVPTPIPSPAAVASPSSPAATPAPSASPTPAPADWDAIGCTAGDAACFCAKQGADGTWADWKDGCAHWFECRGARSYWRACQSGLLYSDAHKYCDWPANVACIAPLAPGPATPAGTPSPSPSPAALPSPPPPAALPSPPPPAALPSPPPPSPKASPPPPALSPTPSPTASPAPAAGACAVGDAVCFCKAKGFAAGTWADKAASCVSYYECVDTTRSFYRACPAGLRYNEVGKICDWAAQVAC